MKAPLRLISLLCLAPIAAHAGETAAGTVIEIAGVGSFVILSSLMVSWKQMPEAARTSIRKAFSFWKR